MAGTSTAIDKKLNREISIFLRHLDSGNIRTEFLTPITFKDFLTNKMLVIAAIRAGIPYTLFDLIRDYTSFTEDEWADFLDISSKSLQRYRSFSAHHFKPIHSEKILEMAEVTQLGLDVFGNMEKWKLWLNTPHYALGNMMPVELLKDSYGKELVMIELTHINHGILV